MVQAVQNEKKDLYVSSFEDLKRLLAEKDPAWLRELRSKAFEYFEANGFPTTKDEDWKYSDVAPLARRSFRPASSEEDSIEPGRLEESSFVELGAPRLVFVNGRLSSELSRLDDLPEGVSVDPLGRILEESPGDIESLLGRYVSFDEHAFVALNTAFVKDGACIRVADGRIVETPIHVLYLSTQPEVVSYPRTLVAAGANSQSTIVESHVGLIRDVYFSCPVTEIVAFDNAVVDHYKVEEEGPESFHVATVQLHQHRNANVRTNTFSLGGAFVRNNVNTVLDGEGAESALNGLYLKRGSQHVDSHTRLEHRKPHGDSRELYKGILDGTATGVFHGRILVHPGAQKTDSKQTNNNLLLSNDALINTKPQLEIYADDVKCTHGATIGQLDPDAEFYLRSRGIAKDTTRSLLIYAFASDMVNRVRVESLQEQLAEYLFNWLPRGELVKEAV